MNLFQPKFAIFTTLSLTSGINDLNSSIKYYNHRKLRLKLKLVLLSAVGFLRESVKGFLDDEGKSHCLLDNIQFDFSEEQLLTISDFKAILNEIREIRTAYFLNEIFNFFTKLENSNEELQISWINFKSFKFIAFFDTLSTQFYDLFLELRDVLYRETMIPSVLENTNGNFKEVKNSNLKCAVNDKILKKRFLLRSLSSLDNNLHGLKVKILHCFKILNEDDKVVEKYDEFLKTFNTVGKDIEIISSDYQLAVLGATDDEKLLEETLKNEEVNSTFESKIKTVLQEFRINEDTPFTEELNVREELFEAETEIEDVSDIKKVLSREERIMLQRSERLEKEKLKLIVKPEILLLNELKNVLNCRKK
ncbi:hypothetical protein HDU92_007832 [Lobulomyces angularis]|nr:hypothetical protein HDU92_007832 [Lobulomyces angularis]